MELQIPHNWQPRNYQMAAWDYLDKGGRNAVLVWHRSGGKDLFCMNRFCKAMVQRPGLYWHCFPIYDQGRKVIWDSMTDAGISYLDVFPQELIRSKNNHEMKIEFKNGSVYKIVGSDNPDSLRGPNVFGVAHSEYSVANQDAANVCIPKLDANGGWQIYIFTPAGRNHGYKIYEFAQNEMRDGRDWFAQLLTINDTWYVDPITKEKRPVVTKEQLDEKRRKGMEEAFLRQEYFCSWDAPLQGAYYKDAMIRVMDEGRLCDLPYDPRKVVHTGWDIGVGDACCVWMFQFVDSWVHFIDYYETEGKGLAYNIGQIKPRYDIFGKHLGPHDLFHREGWYGETLAKKAREFGFHFHVLPKASLSDGIDSVRSLLPRSKFDVRKCARGLECLRGYHKQKIMGTDVFSDAPVHDQYSDGADAFRYVAVGEKVAKNSERTIKREAVAVSQSEQFGWS